MASPQLQSLALWTLDYVLNLPRGEFDWIDFKASTWLSVNGECLDRLSCYLSAWANYEGGYLVIGVTDPNSGEGLVVDEGVDLSLKGGVKGWLEDKLPSLVDAALTHLEVHEIPLEDKPGKGVVVIHVPGSEGAPHQARDRKFYTRLGSKLSPLPRTAIFDIANRQKHPVISSSVTITLFNPDINDSGRLVWQATNESMVFCQHVAARIEIPIRYKKVFLHFEDVHLEEDEKGASFYVWTVGNNINHPLFPLGKLRHSTKANLVRDITDRRGSSLKHGPPIVRIKTYADSAPYVVQEFPIEDILSINDPEF